LAHGKASLAAQQELIKGVLASTLSHTLRAVGGGASASGASHRHSSPNDALRASGVSDDMGWELKTQDFAIDRAQKLGSGAFGEVYGGTCRGKRVAIKELSGKFDDALIGAFRSEVQTLAALRHPNLILLMGVCTTVDHQILTNDGFLFLDDVLARVERDAKSGRVTDWRGLTVANYDPRTKQLVYDVPCALVVKESDRLVEFSTDDDDDANISLHTTPDHQLYVSPAQAGVASRFAKMAAAEACKLDAVRFVASAQNGVATSDTAAAVVAAQLCEPLHLSRAHVEPFLTLVGVWLRSSSARDGAATIKLDDARDEQFVVNDLLATLDLIENVDWRYVAQRVIALECARFVRFFAALRGDALPSWCWSLTTGGARALLRGWERAGAIFVSSASLCDEVVRLALHGGLTATFERAAAAWRVSVSKSRAASRPMVRRSAHRVGPIANPHADRRVWCFTMPQRAKGRVVSVGGFVVMRRALADANGALVRASRPTVQGNCFELGNLAIVTEFMERGSVYDLLHDKKAVVSLKRRMMFAKDCALGMSWLHGATPAILHLDLKTANVLVDDTWTAKIGDFGLAQQKRSVNAGRVGSPVYMAPEMLQSIAFTEKVDVYSFGVILWELFTKKEPFEGKYADVADLTNAVVNREQRPEMPADMPDKLRVLIEQCWAQSPAKRPSFVDVCKASTLDDVVIDAHISAPNQLARDMWRAKFGTKFAVSFRELVRQLCATLEVDAKSVAPNSLRADCLAAVLDVQLNQQTGRDDDNDAVDEVTLESFGRMLEWFGPIEKGQSLFLAIDEVLQLPGFFGDIATAAAEAALKADGKKGTYLIRFSSTPGSYAITLINKKGALEHYRIAHTPGQPYKMANMSFASLSVLLKTTRDDLYLKKALSGGRFEKLYAAHNARFQNSEGYVAVLD
jgi:serine/threonine protein kinase